MAKRSNQGPTIGFLIAQRLDEQIGAFLRREPALIAGPTEDDVHQARVALRRLRSDLRLFRPYVRPPEDAVGDVAWLARELGTVRDLDVLAGVVGAAGRRQGMGEGEMVAVATPLGEARAAARTSLTATLLSPRQAAVTEALEGLASAPPLRRVDAAAAEVMPTLVRRAWNRMVGAAVAVPPAADGAGGEALHRLRILVKRSRYAVEASSGLGFPRSELLARRLADLQDHLGEYHDHVVAQAWLERLRTELGTADEAFVAGRVLGSVVERRAALAESWAVSWRRVDRARLRQWF